MQFRLTLVSNLTNRFLTLPVLRNTPTEFVVLNNRFKLCSVFKEQHQVCCQNGIFHKLENILELFRGKSTQNIMTVSLLGLRQTYYLALYNKAHCNAYSNHSLKLV